MGSKKKKEPLYEVNDENMKVSAEEEFERSRRREFEGKTLMEAIQLTNGQVKIGTANGSGFIYCGNAVEFRMKTMLDIEAEYARRTHHQAENAQSKFNRLFADPAADVRAYLNDLAQSCEVKTDIEPNLEDYLRWLSKRFEQMHRIAERVVVTAEREEKRKPIYERPVVRAYPSIDGNEEMGTLIMLIDGYETGNAWTTEEYEALKGEKHESEEDR